MMFHAPDLYVFPIYNHINFIIFSSSSLFIYHSLKKTPIFHIFSVKSYDTKKKKKKRGTQKYKKKSIILFCK